MDNDDKTITPDETMVEAPAPPEQPKTTVEGFLYSLGSVIRNLRTTYRISENGALKLVQFGLEYDLSRRHMRQEESVGSEASDQ